MNLIRLVSERLNILEASTSCATKRMGLQEKWGCDGVGNSRRFTSWLFDVESRRY